MTHLCKTDRQEIYLLKAKGYSLREIAKALARSPSTISRELRRNAVKGIYTPQKANQKSAVRWKYRKTYLKKIIQNSEMENYIRQKIILGWSPEQVSGAWNLSNETSVSPITVYKYVYSNYGIGLTKHLLSKRVRRKKCVPKTRREMIPQRIWIDDRPQIIENKERIGDWEADLICSRREDKTVILTLLERKSRFLVATLLPNKKPATITNAIKQKLQRMPCHSLTFDNGIEFSHHYKLREILNCETYFCHPYSSWEKGAVEYANRLIRRRIPKKSFIKNYSEHFLQDIIYCLNHTPRKCLLFHQPHQVFFDLPHSFSYSLFTECCV
jgi:IS30 family transposase